MSDTDLLFKALADPGRRKLLDRLHAHDGQTLNALCRHMGMTRQGVTQHLAVLEAANLVAVKRSGREKLHFLNPVPLQEIYDRWICKFERPRLGALRDLKERLEATPALAEGHGKRVTGRRVQTAGHSEQALPPLRHPTPPLDAAPTRSRTSTRRMQ